MLSRIIEGKRRRRPPTCGRMVTVVSLSVVPAMVWSSQGSMNTTRPSLVLGTIMPTATEETGCRAQ